MLWILDDWIDVLQDCVYQTTLEVTSAVGEKKNLLGKLSEYQKIFYLFYNKSHQSSKYNQLDDLTDHPTLSNTCSAGITCLQTKCFDKETKVETILNKQYGDTNSTSASAIQPCIGDMKQHKLIFCWILNIQNHGIIGMLHIGQCKKSWMQMPWLLKYTGEVTQMVTISPLYRKVPKKKSLPFLDSEQNDRNREKRDKRTTV